MATTMTAATSTSSGTDQYEDFEQGVYDVAIRGLKFVPSNKYKERDGTPKQQVELQCELPDVTNAEGDLATTKLWVNAVILPPDPESQSANGRKGSNLWRLIAAVTGRQLAEGDDIDLDILIGMRFRAYCELSDKGYPRIKADTIAGKKASRQAQAVVAPPPTTPARTVFVDEAPAQPAPPKAPTPPVAPAPAMISPDEMARVREGFAEAGYGDGGALADWLAQNYDERTLAQIKADEVSGLYDVLKIAPF